MNAKNVSESYTNLAAQPPLAEKDRQMRQQFLQFRLQADLRAAIEIDRVTELVSIRLDRVVPMPHLSPAVMGVYNWRGEILWIVDLAILLGLDSIRSPQFYRHLQPTIILRNSQPGEIIEIGLLVAEIEEIEWGEIKPIQSLAANFVDSKLLSWAKSYWQVSTDEKFLVLDEQAIFNSPKLNSNI